MKKLALHWKIIIGLLLGIVWALFSGAMGWSRFTLDWIAPFGTIFINLLKLIAVPLVLFSIIKGISGFQDVKSLGRIGAKTLLLYLSTTILAVVIGVTLVNTIKPGNFISKEQRTENRKAYEQFVAATDGVELLDNGKASDEAVAGKVKEATKKMQEGPLQFLVDMVPSNIFMALNDNSLMLQVIFFAIFFGITLLLLPKEKSKPLDDFTDSANEVFLKMVDIVMQGAPFFVFALLAGKISELAGDNINSAIEIFKGLGWYSLTVVVGLGIMTFLIYPLLLKVFVPKMPYRQFFRSIAPAQMLAFSTSSSAATLPVTIECVNDNLKVPKEISSFVLPIGATVNMDGTSLYQAVAVIFLAQFHMVDLTLMQQLVIVLTATLASIGSAAVPSAGLVMLIIVLESVGLNPAWIAIVFPVDRILDMCRTVVNVTGDTVVATVVAKTEGKL